MYTVVHFRLFYDCEMLFIFYCTSYWHFITFQIVFRLWKIVPPTRADSHTPPAEYRNSYKDFYDDDRCHSKSSFKKSKYLSVLEMNLWIYWSWVEGRSSAHREDCLFLLVTFHYKHSGKDYCDVIYTIILDRAGFFIFCIFMFYCWRSNYQVGRIGIP